MATDCIMQSVFSLRKGLSENQLFFKNFPYFCESMRFLLFCWIYLGIGFTLSAKTFTLQEYGEMLQTIEVIAKQSIQKKEYSLLVKELERIPEKIVVSYTVENKTIEKNTHLVWLKTYLSKYISETETENGKKITEILENAQETDDNHQSKIIPVAEKVQTLITTLQNMREELLLMGYKSEDEQAIKNKLNKLLTDKFEEQNETEKKTNWLNEKLKNLYNWLNKNFKGIKNVWNWFLVVLLVGLIIIIAVKAKKYIRNSEKFVEEATHNGLLQADDPRSSKELVLKAKEHEKKGDFRMAVRYYYVAFIIGLEEREILAYQPYFTNWEYHRKLFGMGYEQEEIYYLTAFFDKVWYGMHSVLLAEYQNYTLNYEKTKNILATAKT